jgi:hypothetical protein
MSHAALDEFERADLNGAIEGLYAAFSGYGVDFPLSACALTVSPEDQQWLASKPLRELGPYDLAFYSFKAITTFGTVADFKHFLPRIFELVATVPGYPRNPEIVVGGKLAYANWRSWPETEQVAVERYFRALWRDTLAQFRSVLFADECLGCIAQAVEELGPFLRYWEAAVERDQPARLHLAEYVCGVVGCLREGRVVGAFWEDHPERSRQVSTWLLSPVMASKVERSFDDFVRDPEGAGWEFMLKQYQELRGRPG